MGMRDARPLGIMVAVENVGPPVGERARKENTHMSAQENKVLARRFFEEVTGQRNLDLAKELFDADYKHHDPGLPPQMQESRDAYIGHLPMYYDAFPDFELSLDDILAEGDEVAARWSFTGTHQGDLMGVPATGRQVRASGMTIQRVSDGKIVEGWTIFDTMGLMQQLGVMEQPPG
jgi:steroid delta-isomerase-like uncharacterized protein